MTNLNEVEKTTLMPEQFTYRLLLLVSIVKVAVI